MTQHETNFVLMTDEYLQHHGILGMHWGIRRFQPYPKGWGGIKGKFLGKKQKLSPVQKRRNKIMKKRLEKANKKKQEAIQQEEKRRQQYEENKTIKEQQEKDAKQKAIRSGNVETINKYKHLMDNRELQEAITRIDLEKKLQSISKDTKNINISKMSKKDKKSFEQRLDTTMKWHKKGNDVLSNTLSTYKNLQKLYKINEARKAGNIWDVNLDGDKKKKKKKESDDD